MSLHNAKCFNNHLGFWTIDDKFFASAYRAIRAGTWPMKNPETLRASYLNGSGAPMYGTVKTKSGEEDRMYKLLDGVAVMYIDGPMMKGYSKMGGCSSIELGMQLKQATKDAEVKSVLMMIDSPGGTVAGTDTLATRLNATKQEKPVYAQINDSCNSGAYWIASQCTKVFANPTALMGNIGTFIKVEDSSKQAEMQGITVHVISTGEMKGAFTDGAPITKEQLDILQGTVNDLNEFFLKAVSSGRNMDIRNVRKVATGESFIASKALELGLIDGVQAADDTYAKMVKSYTPKKKESSVQDNINVRLRLLENS